MSRSLAKKRKFERLHPPEGESEPEFQVAPMVDILLVLLLFFMATATTEVLQQKGDYDLPRADQAKTLEDLKKELEESGQSGELSIVVDKSVFTAPLVRAEEVTTANPEDLIPVIQRARMIDAMNRGVPPEQNITFRVVIRADRDTPYSFISQIMQAAGRAGVANVTFATQLGGEESPVQGGEG